MTPKQNILFELVMTRRTLVYVTTGKLGRKRDKENWRQIILRLGREELLYRKCLAVRETEGCGKALLQTSATWHGLKEEKKEIPSNMSSCTVL